MTNQQTRHYQALIDAKRMDAAVSEEITVWTDNSRLMVWTRQRKAGNRLRASLQSFPLYPETISE